MLGRGDRRRLKPVVWRVLTAKAMPLQNCPGTNLNRVSRGGNASGWTTGRGLLFLANMLLSAPIEEGTG